jgi:hypothetical protein
MICLLEWQKRDKYTSVAEGNRKTKPNRKHIMTNEWKSWDHVQYLVQNLKKVNGKKVKYQKQKIAQNFFDLRVEI